jgi:hypothetical protein
LSIFPHCLNTILHNFKSKFMQASNAQDMKFKFTAYS